MSNIYSMKLRKVVSSLDQEMVPKFVLDILKAQMEELNKQLAAQGDELTRLRNLVEQLLAQNAEKDRIIEEKLQIIANFQRMLFGRSSEKRKYILSAGQMCMFDVAEDGMIPQDESTQEQEEQPEKPEETVHVAGHERKKKRTLEEMAANLETVEEIYDLPEEEKVNANGEPLKCIGVEEVRTELIREPEKIYLKKILKKVYVDPRTEQETGQAEFHSAPTPTPLIPHSYASASVITDVYLKKYADALPLYRQETIWKRLGVELYRGTLSNWVITVADKYLMPIWELMKEGLLKLRVIHADETALQVNHEPGRSAQEESRIWAYASSKRAPYQIRLFWYESSRKGACATNLLNGFAGILVCDGYSGYDLVNEVIRAGCWAHMRRKWLEAMPRGATVLNSKGAVGYDYCNRLFDMEKNMESLSDDDRLAERKKEAAKLVKEYYDWVDTLFKPSGKLKDAVTYAVNQKEYLCAFLSHGEVEISNNQVENSIRPIVVGRKNWLFCDTQAGARASAIVYSIMESVKANGLNPEKYFNYILTVLPERFAKDPKANVSDLLPWNHELQAKLI